MSTISQLKTKLLNALNSKLSIREQTLTSTQKDRILANLGITGNIDIELSLYCSLYEIMKFP